MNAAILQLCLLKLNEDLFYQFIVDYRRFCLTNEDVKQNVRKCTSAIFKKKAYLKHIADIFKCSYETLQFDLMPASKLLYNAEVRIFDEQEWHYPSGSPIIIPGLFIKNYRIKVSLQFNLLRL